MTWIKTYEAYVYEAQSDKDVEKLEKILKFPTGSGVFKTVEYDSTRKELLITQPTDLNAMDAGAVITAINREKAALKKAFSGVKKLMVDELQIEIK